MSDIVEKARRMAETMRRHGQKALGAAGPSDVEQLADEIERLRADNARLKKREGAAEDILTEIEDHFDGYADADEDRPNREAALMALCAEWLGPVPDTLRPPTAALEPEGR